VGRIAGAGFEEKTASTAQPSSPDSYQNNSDSQSGAGAVLFGLPGNPVAVMVTFYAFVREALLRMAGATPQPLPLLRARAAAPIRKKPGRTEYQRGIVERGADGHWQVRLTGGQGSGILRSMSQANGLVVLGHAQGAVEAGDWLDVLPFDGLI
jgi:molybdopterin molybdotransferase